MECMSNIPFPPHPIGTGVTYQSLSPISANTDAHAHRHVLVDFREDGVTPYLTIWKHGLVETKV